MVRLSLPAQEGDHDRRTEVRLREADRSNRRAAELAAASNTTARHYWTTAAIAVSHNVTRRLVVTDFTQQRNDGVCYLDDTGLVLLRPGRWSLNLFCYSDGGTSGVMRVAMQHNGDTLPMFDTRELRDTRWRGAGFSGAGRLDQPLTWTGAVSAAEAAQPITFYLLWLGTDTAVTPAATSTLSAVFLGDATEAGELRAPEDYVPQDDAAAGSGGGSG